MRLQTAEGEDVVVLDTFETDVLHEGVTMSAGSPLVAGSYGSGYIRSTPEVRRVASLFSAILEPGDPVAYSPLHFLRPAEALGGQAANVLHMPNTGDNIVSINTGITQARAMGLIGNEEDDPRYGMSVDHWLIEKKVVQGIEDRGPYICNDGLQSRRPGIDGSMVRSSVDLPKAVKRPYLRPRGRLFGYQLPEIPGPGRWWGYAISACTLRDSLQNKTCT